MSRFGNPACGWSASGLMADNLKAQLAPLELYGAGELALPAAMALRAVANGLGAALSAGWARPAGKRAKSAGNRGKNSGF